MRYLPLGCVVVLVFSIYAHDASGSLLSKTVVSFALGILLGWHIVDAIARE